MATELSNKDSFHAKMMQYNNSAREEIKQMVDEIVEEMGEHQAWWKEVREFNQFASINLQRHKLTHWTEKVKENSDQQLYC